MAFKAKTAADPNEGELQYHLRIRANDLPKAVLLPGDPERVGKIGALWDSFEEVAYHRQYRSVRGQYQQTPISCTSTGIGTPGLAIAVDELLRTGTTTFIRVGTCGGLQPETKVGDVIISTGAVRLDGASKDFVIPEYPAIADYRVVAALVEAAKKLGVRYHVGITASTDTFYAGQGRVAYQNYMPSHKEHIFADMQKAGVMNFEMEASCLFVMGTIYKVLTGAICVVVADRVGNKFKVTDEMQMTAARVASEAVVILHKQGL